MKLNSHFFGSSNIKLRTINGTTTKRKQKGKKMQEKEMQKRCTRAHHTDMKNETALMGKISSEHRQA